MTEPRRWLEARQTSAELRHVLEAASAPPPMPAELHARVSELAVQLASQSLLAQVGGVSLWQKLLSTFSGASKSLALASLLGAAGAGTYVATRASQPPSASASRAPPRAAKSELPTSAIPELLASPSSNALTPQRGAPRDVAVQARVVARAAPSVAPEPSAAVAASAASSGAESIADEAKLLETARSFLGDSPALALALTEQHRRLHSAPQLIAEREFIAIEALLRLGRRQEAERRAAPRLEQDPDSLYARRLRQLLSTAGGATSKSDNH